MQILFFHQPVSRLFKIIWVWTKYAKQLETEYSKEYCVLQVK